jgi:hypothetical protein
MDRRLDPLHLDLSARKKGRRAGQEWRRRVDRCEWQEQESEDQEEAVHFVDTLMKQNLVCSMEIGR